MFKNLMLYRLAPGWPGAANQLEAALGREPFAECGATQQKSSGWAPPRGQAHGALVETVAGQWLARLVIENKPVPAQTVRRKAEEEAARIERTTGRKPGKRELRDLREDALLALLPQAFARRAEVAMWIEPKHRWLALDAASPAKADEAIASLVRVAGKGFAISPLQTRSTPQALMTAWLLAEKPGDLPRAFHIERDCELKASGEEPSAVRFTRHELATPEVRRHVREGKRPVRLALSWQGRVGFALTESLQIKKIRFDEGVFEQEQTSEEDRFDADAAIVTGELTGLIGDLIEALGGQEG
ncbi:MAG: recombination-associated protein RdgC [Burkholderiaceae bacterium]|nr:recombination-associated protein RdgC [Burkholderiaceae bacterium]